MLIIILLTLLWMRGAIITCGILIHYDLIEYGDDAWISMLLCTLIWPLIGVLCLLYLVFFNLGKLAIAVAGFLDSLKKKKDRHKAEDIVKELKAYLKKYDEGEGVKVKYILQILYGEDWDNM